MNLIVEDILSLSYVRAVNIERLQRRTRIHVSTDSRTTQRGDVFFAIKGEKFDGHQFIQKAFEHGAELAVVDERGDYPWEGEKPLLMVNDATKSLGQLALRYRKKFDMPFIAVAGSNGKTTTKDMIAAVLGKKFYVLKTEGNRNNHIGVPQTLFQLKKKHEIAVAEIGTNHFGELSYLCSILLPTHGLITNIGREHLEFFIDLEGVARAEGELFESLGTSGVGFVNADDPWVVQKAKKLRKMMQYGFAAKNVHVRGKFLGMNEKSSAAFSVKARGTKQFAIQLSIRGKHAIANALAAAAVGLAFKVPPSQIRRALETFAATGKRMDVRTVAGVTIVDDTYNANPDSMRAALETLQAMQCRGKKIIVLADMLELGDRSEKEHRKIGTMVSTIAEYLLTYGPKAKFINDEANVKVQFHYEQKNILSEYLSELVAPGDVVLVKGSRGMAMEDVVTFLTERLKTKDRRAVSLMS